MTTEIEQSTITLRKMDEKEYSKYLTWAINDYAEDKIRAGNWRKDEALNNSEKEFNSLLPEGLESENNFLFHITNEDKRVGHIWYYEDGKFCFIYDFHVYENYRRQGFAFQTLNLLEKEMTEKKCSYIGLHVFGFNILARKLYEKCGYVKELRSTEQNILMRKTLNQND
ncbi:MAG: GNAT family N-acetyltransferase [Candidatus Delongbacteria bacterium]|nr:GNAT family N-acetyltransferase [Candidatus Delongbacteria bacterium]